MTNFDCNGDWLVEYSDGELSSGDSAQAKVHLAACLACTREFAALQNSREKLSAYFISVGQPSQAVQDGLGSPSYKPQRTSWNAAPLALASIAATALLVSVVFFLVQEQGKVAKTVSPAPNPSGSPAAEQPQEEDVLAMISRETQIARLRAASEILAKEPGMNARHLALEKYLADAYGVATKRRPVEM